MDMSIDSRDYTHARRYTQAELDAERDVEYQRGITRGATLGIVWATAVIGVSCTFLLWLAGVL